MVSSPHISNETKLIDLVNELSTTIDLDSTLVRAEALFRRFQRTVEAIDKKSNFPAPKLRQRNTAATQNASLGGTQSLRSSSPTSPSANTSGVDTVSASATNSGPSTDCPGEGASSPSAAPAVKGNPKGKGKGKNDGRKSAELEEQRPKVISPELRGLLSRKVEVLPRKVVRKEGEGLSSLKK